MDNGHKDASSMLRKTQPLNMSPYTASQVNKTRCIGASLSVMSAVIGSVHLASRIMGMSAASNHGEVLALIIASILASSSTSSSSSTPSSILSPLIYSDHLHSVRLIQDVRS